MAASAEDEDLRDRRFLADILAPLAPGESDQIASLLVDTFGSLASVFAATPEARARVAPSFSAALAHLTLVREASLHAAASGARRVGLSGLQAVSQYLLAAMAAASAEEVRILFCDAKGGLIRNEIVASGSIGRAPVYPREIIRRALDLGAASLVMAHNHPSGDPTPSAEDIVATRQVASAAALFDIELFDHIIVARRGWLSLRAEGLL